MCGRYTIHDKATDIEELKKHFSITRSEIPELFPRYNAAPSQMLPVVLDGHKTSDRILDTFRWGLIPRWAKDESIGYKTINARCESLTEKSTYRKPFTSQRCLVVASGFYEWDKAKVKTPHLYQLKNNPIIGFAGLYDLWKSPEGDVLSYTIITTDANEIVNKTHPRMPVILYPSEYNFWLDPNNNNTDELTEILRPYPVDEMTDNAVSTELNNTRNDYPELIETT